VSLWVVHPGNRSWPLSESITAIAASDFLRSDPFAG